MDVEVVPHDGDVTRRVLRAHEEWLVVQSDAVEAARAGGALGTVPMLVLSPVLTKKRYKDGDDARTEASKRSKYKWERHHVPLPDTTPLGYTQVGGGLGVQRLELYPRSGAR